MFIDDKIHLSVTVSVRSPLQASLEQIRATIHQTEQSVGLLDVDLMSLVETMAHDLHRSRTRTRALHEHIQDRKASEMRRAQQAREAQSRNEALSEEVRRRESEYRELQKAYAMARSELEGYTSLSGEVRVLNYD